MEFKAELPEHSDLAKTVEASANDAGGDLNIRVVYDLREGVELDEDKLILIERVQIKLCQQRIIMNIYICKCQ